MLALALLTGCGSDVTKWERENEARLAKEDGNEVMPTPPAFPQRATLLEVGLRSASEFRFFVDGATLDIQPKGVIRYVLVARSPSGVDNVSYEAIRCPSGEYRIYAFGQPGGAWGGRPTEWRSIAAARQPARIALERDYFCSAGAVLSSAEDVRRAFRQGGHPFSKGFSGDALLGR